MRVFISGGCKNGKSWIAQQLARNQGPQTRYYLATMRPVDGEDRERIRRHREERKDWGFTTVEAPDDITRRVKGLDMGASFLLDSTTALLANEMFSRDGSVNKEAGEKVAGEVVSLVRRAENIVVVSDYIFGDYMSGYDSLTRAYCRALATVDRALAAACGTVIEVTYGSVAYHKRDC